jgi:hypothetical protein
MSPTSPPPWGGIAGLLMACLVTLVGVVRGLDPDVILIRATVGGVLLGVLAAVASAILKRP